MPRTQVATVPVYQVGVPLPASATNPTNPMLQFAVPQEGVPPSNIECRFEAELDTFAVNAKVSADGISWSSLTTANNGVNGVSVSVAPKTNTTVTFFLRPGLDNYIQFNVTAGYGTIQPRGAESWVIQTV